MPEFITEKYPHYQNAIIAKIYATHATPASFLTHGNNRNNHDELMRNLIDGNVADLIISSE